MTNEEQNNTTALKDKQDETDSMCNARGYSSTLEDRFSLEKAFQ